MIEGTIVKVGQGSKAAHETARALEEIVDSVTRVKGVIAEIAGSSNEQAEGIAQINVGLEQVDRVTQQNTAAAEESAAASQELSSQANTLRGVMQKFQLSRNAGTGTQDEVDLSKIELTPELLAALQGYLGGPPAAQTMVAPRGRVSGRVLPSEVISLDDSEFGRY
jgi:methyl-accepting chemotaxis protein